jgi:PAS domain S-box-containing protein
MPAGVLMKPEYSGEHPDLNSTTRCKQLEEKLLLTQFTLDRAADMIFWVAPDGRFTYVNIAACRALGYTQEEFLTLTVFDISTRHNKENWEEHRQELKEHESLTFENTFIAKDGHRFPVELSVNYLAFGGREYNCASVRDITERKRAEEELKAAKAQAELYLDLMGHDINNMHQIALGYLEMAKDRIADPAGNEFLDKSIEVLQRSARLIGNVRKLQKLQEGMFLTETVEVRNMLASIQREFGAVPDKTVTSNLNCTGPCYVRANDLLHDVFANLVGNAIKHTAGRADISINLDRVRENGRVYCRVSVEDDGPGIPEDFKDIIFNRALKGTARAKGTGLGLYLVKSLVDSYGGKVWVEDRVPGDHTKGARFVVMLPAADGR